ncbi:MAG: TolB family protein [Thermoanaerobaculia bacterium]
MKSLLPVLFLTLSAPLLAQAPHAEWRTIETEGFRVHYPAPWEAWARRTAARLEETRDRVEAEVGWEIEEEIDVLVMDPMAVANGMALPFIGWPRLVLWTNPPPPESVIGFYRDWTEILTVHELAHLAHLLRPSRNPLRRFLNPALPLSPIAFRAPRWVTEGYATLIEGDLTASGRPHGDFRATVLRRWAQQGRLPSYSQLASDRSHWLGMSMAYLVGSAYLDWLREREGDDSLQKLWARLTAREQRSFEEAFTGVFGDDPATLYRRFTAELTASAIAVERALEPSLREGELWQDLSWTTGDPALSPDGTKLVTVLRKREGPSRLVVLPLAPDEEAEERYRERIEEMLERDPEDVAPVRRKPLPREPLHELVTADGAEPYSPRWSPDGESILSVRFEPDADGFFHPDLFRWIPESGEVERITYFADVRDADPSPDGGRAVAVRNRFGFSELVTVDLATGSVTSLTPPSLEITYATPRWSPDGARLAWVEQSEGRWRLRVRDIESGTTRDLPLPPRALVAQPAWGDADTLYAAVGSGGFIEIHRLDLADPEPFQVTRSRGAALAPAPAPDGEALFFLSVDADGLDLRRLDLTGELPPLPPLALDPTLAPAIRPPQRPPPPPVDPAEVPPSRPYGIGRQELRPHVSTNWLPSTHTFELGLRAGDVVGRLGALAVASIPIGDGAERGASLASAWRGWPVALRGHLFFSEHDASEQPECADTIPACSGSLLDLERRGLELGASWSTVWRTGRFEADAGALVQRIGASGSEFDQRVVFAELSPRIRRSMGRMRATGAMNARVEGGSTEGDDWSRLRLGLGVEAAWGDLGVAVAWNRDASDSVRLPFDLYALGGTIGTIHPDSALSSRIEVPALPVGTALGEEHEAQKASLAFGAPLRAFYERHRLWNDGSPRQPWIEIAGLEGRFAIGPQPLFRFPGVELRAGVAGVLTGPLEDETTWWIATSWRP